MAAKPKNTKNKKEASVPFRSEVILLLVLAVCIIWFISHFGIGGFVGERISSLSFGLFGMMSYLVPICVFVGVAVFFPTRDSGIGCRGTVHLVPLPVCGIGGRKWEHLFRQRLFSICGRA